MSALRGKSRMHMSYDVCSKNVNAGRHVCVLRAFSLAPRKEDVQRSSTFSLHTFQRSSATCLNLLSCSRERAPARSVLSWTQGLRRLRSCPQQTIACRAPGPAARFLFEQRPARSPDCSSCDPCAAGLGASHSSSPGSKSNNTAPKSNSSTASCDHDHVDTVLGVNRLKNRSNQWQPTSGGFTSRVPPASSWLLGRNH